MKGIKLLLTALLLSSFISMIPGILMGWDVFFYLCISLTIVFIISGFRQNIRDEHINKKNSLIKEFNILNRWESNDHDYKLTVSEMIKYCELDDNLCKTLVANAILKDIDLYAIYKHHNNDIKKSINFIYEKYPLDINVIEQQLLKDIKKVEKEEKKQERKEFIKEIQESCKEDSISKSPKQQYKANKKAGIVSCPKCGSQSITTDNKKISVGKGVAGAVVGSMVNPVGTVIGGAVGATHSKKIYNVCMNCGHKWKP